MPRAKTPMMNNTAHDLFPGALEMMILESLRRQQMANLRDQVERKAG